MASFAFGSPNPHVALSTLYPYKKSSHKESFFMADRVGFEPTLGFRPKHTFQACAFNHSATYPYYQPSVFCGFGARRAPCKIKDFIPCGTVLSDVSRVPLFGSPPLANHSATYPCETLYTNISFKLQAKNC